MVFVQNRIFEFRVRHIQFFKMFDYFFTRILFVVYSLRVYCKEYTVEIKDAEIKLYTTCPTIYIQPVPQFQNTSKMGRGLRNKKVEEKGDSDDDVPLKELLTRRASLRDTSSSPQKAAPKKASPKKAKKKELGVEEGLSEEGTEEKDLFSDEEELDISATSAVAGKKRKKVSPKKAPPKTASMSISSLSLRGKRKLLVGDEKGDDSSSEGDDKTFGNTITAPVVVATVPVVAGSKLSGSQLEIPPLQSTPVGRTSQSSIQGSVRTDKCKILNYIQLY